MKPLGTLFLLACLVSMSATHAQDAAAPGEGNAIGICSSYNECLKASGGVTPAMKRCMGIEYAHQDQRLNEAYKALMASLDQAQRTTLRAKERTWIAYRNSYCTLDPEGGQAAELDAFDCSVQATTKQATMLENLLRERNPSH